MKRSSFMGGNLHASHFAGVIVLLTILTMPDLAWATNLKKTSVNVIVSEFVRMMTNNNFKDMGLSPIRKENHRRIDDGILFPAIDDSYWLIFSNCKTTDDIPELISMSIPILINGELNPKLKECYQLFLMFTIHAFATTQNSSQNDVEKKLRGIFSDLGAMAQGAPPMFDGEMRVWLDDNVKVISQCYPKRGLLIFAVQIR